MINLEELEQCGLSIYKPPHFFSHGGATSGRSNRKHPYAIRRKWLGCYLLELNKFEGRCSVILTDESSGYSKKLSQSIGLTQLDAENLFDRVVVKCTR
jgi:hypothetical protein